MTGEKLSFVFQISRPPYISHKWVGTQNVPNDVTFQMIQTPNLQTFYLEISLANSFKVLKKNSKPITPWFLADFSTITKSTGSGSVSFET